MDLDELEEALHAMAPKKPAKTRLQAAQQSSIVDDDEVNAFAVQIEMFIGELDGDITVAELRDLLHSRKMRLALG